MVRAAVRGKCDNLGVDVHSSRLRQIEIFQEQDRSALGHDEAVALRIVGARGALWLFVEVRAEGTHDAEDIEPDRTYGGVGPSGQHTVDALLLNGPVRLPDRIGPGGTARCDDHTGTVQAMVRGDAGGTGVWH